MQPSLNTDEWNAPLPLPEGVPIPPWPQEVFPELFEMFAKELSRSTETPIELASMLILTVVAAATQKRYQVQIKSDYIEPVNIWSLAILPPASRKSRVYSEVTSPLREWEAAQRLAIEPVIQATTSKRKTIEARLKELRTQASKVADAAKYESLQQQIEDMEKETPSIPSYPQIWTSDITPEHLGTIMAANDETMAVMSDEGGIFDILSGLYSDGKANLDLFLQAHSAGSTKVDRGSRPSICLQRALLTIALTVQPSVIKTICANKTFRGRGLLGRFLFVIPKSNIGSRTLEEPSMKVSIRDEFRKAIKTLLDCSNSTENKEQYLLTFTLEAYSKWLERAKVVEQLMGDEIGHLSHITDWAGKLSGACARIAGLLHIMRFAHQKPWEHPIGPTDVTAAIKICHALTNHALVVFDLLQEDSSAQIARLIIDWIKQRNTHCFTQRECLRHFRRHKKADIRPALALLIDHEILRESEVKPATGRASNVFFVNPHIFQK